MTQTPKGRLLFKLASGALLFASISNNASWERKSKICHPEESTCLRQLREE
jgi:hypothetical protein